MRLIDADALLTELLSLTWLGCDGGYYKGMAAERDATISRIAEAETIDAVPVVHCKDCVHGGNCMIRAMISGETEQDNPYCSAGAKEDVK